MAPEGTVYWCPQCGRISADRHGRLAMLGWSAECTSQAVLITEATMKIDAEGRVIEADVLTEDVTRLPLADADSHTHH